MSQEKRTERIEVEVKRNADNVNIFFDLCWENGKFMSARVIKQRIGEFTIPVRQESIYLDGPELIALRELIQEVNTITNNPPVGCEPV